MIVGVGSRDELSSVPHTARRVGPVGHLSTSRVGKPRRLQGSMREKQADLVIALVEVAHVAHRRFQEAGRGRRETLRGEGGGAALVSGSPRGVGQFGVLSIDSKVSDGSHWRETSCLPRQGRQLRRHASLVHDDAQELARKVFALLLGIFYVTRFHCFFKF